MHIYKFLGKYFLLLDENSKAIENMVDAGWIVYDIKIDLRKIKGRRFFIKD